MHDTKKLLFLISEDSYFITHRLNLAKSALRAGFQVAIATRINHHLKTIEAAGIIVFPLKYFGRSSINPIQQIKALIELFQIYRQYKPSVVHHVAVKPVLYGTLVAKLCQIPKIINALGGLGYLFTEDPDKSVSKKMLLRFLVCQFFRWINSFKNTTLILQNEDDIKRLIAEKSLVKEKVVLIRGAGVDIHTYKVTTPPVSPPFIITCISRMLWDKGIGDLMTAAQILQHQQIPVKVILYGLPDPNNPRTIPEAELKHWHEKGYIDWRQYCDDVASAYQNCHIAILPSYYREGLPKTLLEAASSGRPIITTDVVGCREIVENGVNGLLVPARDPNAIANAIIQLIEDESLRIKMGEAGRKIVEACFSDTFINEQTIKLY